MFVINPNAFIVPSFRIPPFVTQNVAFNHHLPNDDFAKGYFDQRFGKGHWQYTFNGREAIKMAIESYNFDKNDLITILTTSENFYISSCVTLEMDMVCRWNREITPETKLIFVNHEFGYPYPDMEKLLQTGLPIIEDCATTFFSQDDHGKVGKYGDYAIYSFPKFFPTQLGGMIVSNKKAQTQKSTMLNETEANYIEKVMSHYLKNEKELLQKRRENFEYAVAKFSELGFTERFQSNEKIVPSALMLSNHSIVKDLNALKIYLNNNGIQNSVFYGEDAFFIPNHQNLSTTEIDYIWEVLSHFLKNDNR
jgi:hypothetical protein